MKTILLTLIFCTTFIQFSTAQSVTDSLLLYYGFDGNANGVAAAYDAVVSGPVLGTDRNGFSNFSYSFDGVDDGMRIAPDSAYKVQYPITISSWVYTADSSNGGLGSTIFSNNDLTSIYYGFSLQLTTTGGVAIGYGSGSNAGSQFRRTGESTAKVKSNEWTHIVGIVEGPTNMTIYINGVSVAVTNSGSGGAIVAYSADSATIGTRFNPFGAASYYNGKIDEIGFWKRALTANEVNQLYSNPLSVGLLLYYAMDNTLTNSGIVANVDLTVSGSATQTAGVNGMNNTAYEFDGVDDVLNIPHDNGYKVQYPLTMSAWIYTGDSSHNGNGTTIFNNNDLGTIYYGVSLNTDPTGTISATAGTGTGAGIQFRRTVSSNLKINNNKWVHLTTIMEGPTNMRIFFDGVEDMNTTYSGSGGSTIAYDVAGGRIGSSGNPFGAIKYFEGKIDEVKFWNRALAPSEIMMNAQAPIVSSVSMIDGAKAFELNIAPNPVSDQFTINTDLTNFSATIFNINGQTLFAVNNVKTIDVSQLSAGVYFLKIDNRDKNQSGVLKFLKN